MDDQTSPIEPETGEFSKLLDRIGRVHARQRLGIEEELEARGRRGGFNFFHAESWYSIHAVVRWVLRIGSVYGRARRNAERVRVRENVIDSPRLPAAFDGFIILHITDLHADISRGAMRSLEGLLPELNYDICVITGDFRGATFGPFTEALGEVALIRRHLRGSVYGVLGNHDSLHMVPHLEAMGIRMLLNETITIERGDQCLYVAGIDDAHLFRGDNIHRATEAIPDCAFSILLSHTPEVYRQAANAGFDLMLSGHTHGGQLCLPGGAALTLDTHMPRRYGAGAWVHRSMAGYTSVGAGTSMIPVRLNCAPEIVLHRLIRR